MILFIGDTGLGKSITVNMLLGHEMEMNEDDGSIDIRQPVPAGLPVAMISHEVDSGMTLPYTYMCQETHLSYLDCPGFYDTRGVEQDTFNALMVRLFVEHCR